MTAELNDNLVEQNLAKLDLNLEQFGFNFEKLSET